VWRVVDTLPMPSTRFLPIAAVSLSLFLVPAVGSASAAPAHSQAKHHSAHHRVLSRGHAQRQSFKARIAIVASAPKISGTTYYVSPSGSDAHVGTSPSQSWKTVTRVNKQSLKPGDGVLFQGGATFTDSDLEPATSGTSANPIVFGSYGAGQASIVKGAWFVQNYLVVNDLRFTSTFYGGSSVQGTSNHDTIENCTITLPAGNSALGIYANGNDWTIADNTVSNTGLSGLLLNGDGYQITGNTINQTGLNTSVAYNAHGIYLDASDATITGNTITNFAESGVSVRYRNSTITGNTISGGQIGIDFYQTDPTAGTGHWTNNTITKTTAADLYVSQAGDYPTRESFVITGDSMKKTSGVYTNLHSTTGSYTMSGNQQL
jgi:parallel beta-helix repeat protein